MFAFSLLIGMMSELVIDLTKFTIFPLKDTLLPYRTSLRTPAFGVVLEDEKLCLGFGNWKLCLADAMLESGSRSLGGEELPCPFAWQILFWKASLPPLTWISSQKSPPKNHSDRTNISILAWEVRIMSLHISCKERRCSICFLSAD